MIIFEKPICKLFLTFSAIIPDDNIQRINELQDKVEDKFKEIKELHSLISKNGVINDARKLYEKIDSGTPIVYRYSKGRIHFSIANYGDHLLSGISNFADFERRKHNYQQSRDYKKQLQEVIDFRERFFRFFPSAIDFEIKGFYLPEKIEKSIALQVFPKDGNFCGDARRLLSCPINMKSHIDKKKSEYFTTNIFRFICGRNDFEIPDENNLLNFLTDLNSSLVDEPIKIKVNPEIVISDPYLANENYLDIKPK